MHVHVHAHETPTKNITNQKYYGVHGGFLFKCVCWGVMCVLVLLFVVWVRGEEVLMRAPSSAFAGV
jgi:hypothetical protein